MASASTSTSEPCPAPPLQEDIVKLQNQASHQDQEEVKTSLANLRKLSDDVQQLEDKYKKEYEALQFAEKQSESFEKALEDTLNTKLTAGEKKKIVTIAGCVPKAADLKGLWLAARDLTPGHQSILTAAQDKLADATADYKNAQDYKANQKDLDDLKTQGTKEFEAQNNRNAYFLVALEMKGELKAPRPPKDFNEYLEGKARAYNTASEAVRKAKIIFDQGKADADKKKKDFDDALTKRRANILKQIADDPFAESAAAPAEPPGTPATADSPAAQGTTPAEV
jgi:hypothetical protein